jgi:hypothetical protein
MKMTVAKLPERKDKPAKRNQMQKRMREVETLGGQCECCGVDDYEFMQVDHVFENGKVVGAHLLCANCHMARTYWNGCPHDPHITTCGGWR